MLQLKYFASLRDTLNSDGEQLECAAATVGQLRQQLAARGGVWAEQLLSGCTLAAVNQQVASDQVTINSGDEVAFFPPVTGG